jgi:hypothetical protein
LQEIHSLGGHNIKAMSREEFVALATARYDELQALNGLDNFYDYEKQFVTIWRDLGRQVLEKNIGEPAKDHRKKKDDHHYSGKRRR